MEAMHTETINLYLNFFLAFLPPYCVALFRFQKRHVFLLGHMKFDVP